jgi:hypothetical protein
VTTMLATDEMPSKSPRLWTAREQIYRSLVDLLGARARIAPMQATKYHKLANRLLSLPLSG